MTGRSYYNEIDPYAAAWLRNLISEGRIAPGEVDERSIADVRPNDLLGYAQCHFFAGIGVWSYALRRAGWPDDLPVWTGSCPCQPFSAAGRGEGFADERHLWPAFHHLIAQRRPPVVFGEQVASKAVDPWIDLVQDDMEGLGYAFGAVPFPSAGVGAPHIRDRAYFVAHACGNRRHVERGKLGEQVGSWERRDQSDDGWRIGFLADMHSDGRDQGRIGQPSAGDDGFVGDGASRVVDDAVGSRLEGQRSGHSASFGHGEGPVRPVAETGEPCWLADAPGGEQRRLRERGTRPRSCELPHRGHGADCPVADATLGGRGEERPHAGGGAIRDRTEGLPAGSFAGGGNQRPGPTNGFWRDPDWLHCRDGRWRPVEPGTFPLVDGSAFRLDSGSAFAGKSRTGMLKGAGNAINAEAAATFISAAMEVFQ